MSPCLSLLLHPPAPPQIYTLSLHDALPISTCHRGVNRPMPLEQLIQETATTAGLDSASRAYRDRKSTRLNSSHRTISYAVFCLKKKKKNTQRHTHIHHTTVPIQRTRNTPLP